MLSYYKFSSVFSLLLSIFRESDRTEQLRFHFSLSCTGEGNGNPLRCSCLENPRDKGAWWASIYGVAQSRTRLSNFAFTFHFRALEKDIAPHSSVLPGDSQGRGAWRAAVCGVAQSRTRLRRLSSSSRYSTAIMTENTLSELWSQQQPLS